MSNTVWKVLPKKKLLEENSFFWPHSEPIYFLLWAVHFIVKEWQHRRVNFYYYSTLIYTSIASILIQSTGTISQSLPLLGRKKEVLNMPNTEVYYNFRRWTWNILMRCAKQRFLDPFATLHLMQNKFCIMWLKRCVLSVWSIVRDMQPHYFILGEETQIPEKKTEQSTSTLLFSNVSFVLFAPALPQVPPAH